MDKITIDYNIPCFHCHKVINEGEQCYHLVYGENEVHMCLDCSDECSSSGWL